MSIIKDTASLGRFFLNLPNFLIKHRTKVFGVIGILLILSSVAIYGFLVENKANANVLDYLTGDFETRKGLDFLKQHFNVSGDAMFAIEGSANDAELATSMEKIAQLDGVTQLIWIDSIDIILTLHAILPEIIDPEEFVSFLKQPIGDDKYIYLSLILHSYDPSHPRAFALLDAIETELAPREVKFAGMTHTAKTVMNDTLEQLPTYVLVAAISILLVFILTSQSLAEPIAFVLILLAGISLNLGVNYFYSSLSVISVATSTLLQLVFSVVFISIVFFTWRKNVNNLSKDPITKTVHQIYRILIPATILSIVCSLGLFFARIDLGGELAFTIGRAIAINFAVILLLIAPLLTVLSKLAHKTAFKQKLDLNYMPILKFLIKARVPMLLLLSTIILVTSYLTLTKPSLSYFKMQETSDSLNAVSQGAAQLSNQLIVVVPVTPKRDKTQAGFIEALNAIDGIDTVLGAFTAIHLESAQITPLLELLPPGSEFSGFFANVDGDLYTMSTIVLKGSADDPSALKTYESILNVCAAHFESSYRFGVLTGVYDMSQIARANFIVIFIAILIASLTLFGLMFHSPLKGLVTALAQVASVCITISIYTLIAPGLNFLVYWLVNVIQIITISGYSALIYATHPKTIKDSTDIAQTISQCYKPILRSAIALAMGCATISFAASNLIVKNLTAIISVGSIIST
ncbi:MAG: hypothetical protein LBE09_08575, partial [Christensenellaceae bacterium]|nr:hypothetical protein [Christensenellaceae bacterium]